MNPLRALVAAFSYFSILPVRSYSAAPDAAVIGWLPLVGLIIGGAAGWCAGLIYGATSAPLWALVVAFVATIVFSGAIHLDGFLDCADALLMTAPARRRLEVLRDPHHGTYAVVAMAVLTVAWIAALSDIAPARMPLVLAVAAVMARAAILPLCEQYVHARTNVRQAGAMRYGIGWFVVIAVVLTFVTHSLQPLVLLVGAYALAQLLGVLAARRLGGMTGDVYGGVEVVTEVAVLIAAPFLLGTL